MSPKTPIAVILCLCVPAIVFGQDGRGALCCGQTQATAEFYNADVAKLYTQMTIETILLRKTNADELAPGEYVLSTSPQGHQFKAVVNLDGEASAWYVADRSGATLALVSANNGGGDDEIDVNACMTKFLDEVAICDQGWDFGISRLAYGQCITGAWSRFLICCRGGNVLQTTRH
jgi:hypothetical protein